jgi:NAD(P)-dependent dehydrogenase (short-subunit alcohol dehydrogenase family)
MRNLRGKTALVTGAASGIGRAIALRLASEGVDLCLLDIDELGLAQCVSQCRERSVNAWAQHCDVGLRREVTAAVNNVLQRWGGVDLLVNNAGITYYGRTHDMAEEHWDRLLDINLHSHLQFTRLLLPTLLARPEAHVVNVCSIFGLVGMPKVNAYCVSKFGLVGFSESLRAEYGREGLGVTAVCPGFVDTRLFSSAPRPADYDAPKEPPQWLRTTADHVARATVRAVRRNRPLVVVEPFARTLYLLKRFMPSLMDVTLHLGRRRRIRKKLTQLIPDGDGVTVAMPHPRRDPGPRKRAA